MRRSRATLSSALLTRTSFPTTGSRSGSQTGQHAMRLGCCSRGERCRSLGSMRSTRGRRSLMARCIRSRRMTMARALSPACSTSAWSARPPATAFLVRLRALWTVASTFHTTRSASRATIPRRKSSMRRPARSTSSAATCRSTWRCSRRMTRTATSRSSPSTSRTTSALTTLRRCTRTRTRQSARTHLPSRRRNRTRTLTSRRRR
mmetsp:Transcript_19107/g.49325  ORF Transcript_19107/g.49325 Transcript_19107/m.49325 type:complete len:205 (+) Transcript_19107:264-878(+)